MHDGWKLYIPHSDASEVEETLLSRFGGDRSKKKLESKNKGRPRLPNKVIHKRLTLLPTKSDWESWEKRIEIHTNIFVPQSFPQLSTHVGFTHQYHTQYHKHTGVQW